MLESQMNVPKAFDRFAVGFCQGSSSEHPTMLHWIDSSLQYLSLDDKRVVKQFIDAVLRGKLTEDELQKIWNQTPADYYVQINGSLRGFFAVVSEEIGKQLSR
jgi:hypothetical protein